MDLYNLIDRIHLQHIENIDEDITRALESDDHEGLFELASTLYQFGLIPQGLKIFDELYRIYPEETELMVFYVEGLIDQNEIDKALVVLHNAPHSTEKLLIEADLYQQQHMIEVALQKLREAEQMTDDIVVQFALAELLYFDGQYLEAAQRYHTILNQSDTMNGINIYSRLADCMLQSGNYEESLSYFNTIDDELMTSDDYFKKAISFEKNDHLQDAIATLTTLLSKDPDYMQAYSLLVNLYEAERMNEEAVNIGKEGLRLNDYFKELLVDTARVMLKIKDKEAEHLLIKALKIDPEYTEAALMLTDYYRNEEQYEEIINLFTLINETDLDPVIKWALAISYQHLEKDKEAIHFYSEAFVDLSENIDFLNDYYNYLIEVGQDKSDIETKLILLDPNFEPYE